MPIKPDDLRDRFLGAPDRLQLLREAAHILVIDDEKVNLLLVTSLLRRAGYASVATLADATRLEQQLQTQAPDLVILDLHMPGRDGFSVLQALQRQVLEEHLPVLVVSGDLSVDARRRALALGARDFLTKPYDLVELTLRVRNQLETRLLYLDVRKQNRALLEAIHGRTRQLEDARLEVTERLAVAAEYRDDDTSQHTRRVGERSALLARMVGLDEGDAGVIARAAALHDVGKIGIPDALLLKPGRLTEEEMRIMRTHTTIGAHILGGSADPILQLAEVIALSHHERWDGTGYPKAIAGEAIPLAGRIVAVTDAFDAMTHDRPYRAARCVPAALAEIRAMCGTQFDAAVVDALVEIVANETPQGADCSSSPANRS